MGQPIHSINSIQLISAITFLSSSFSLGGGVLMQVLLLRKAASKDGEAFRGRSKKILCGFHADYLVV